MILFTIDTSTRMVDLNKEWISTIKEFKKLLVRDKGSIGDADGRRKLKAIKEFTFIYHYCDYKSKFVNFSELDMLRECLKNAELSPDLDIEKDPELMEAVIRYKSLQDLPELKVLHECKETLHSAHRVVKKLRAHLETKLTSTDLNEVEEAEESKRRTSPVKMLTDMLIGVMDIASKIPAAVEAIEKQEDKIKIKLGEDGMLRGNSEKGTREDKSVRKITGNMTSDI